jgi:hypothetical protein
MLINEDSDSHDFGQPDNSRDRWREMQSAYSEYLRASEALKTALESRLLPDASSDAAVALPLLEDRSGAFERYLEARMGFLERRFDECISREPELHSAVHSAVRFTGPTRHSPGSSQIDSQFAKFGRILTISAAAMFCLMAFSLYREQAQVRNLEEARYELRVTSRATYDGLQLLAKKLEVLGPLEQSARQQTDQAAQPAPGVAASSEKSAGGDAPWQQPPRQTSPPPLPKAQPIAKTTSRRIYHVSLSRSSQFQRVGPIQLSLRSVDLKRNSVSVRIVSQSGTVDFQQLKLNQPVRIKSGRPDHTVEFVVDRVAPNGLYGHLIEKQG